MKDVNILNVLKLNIHQMVICMFCTGQRTISTVYQSRHERVTHLYLTRFCEINFSEESLELNQSKFSTLVRGSRLLNKILKFFFWKTELITSDHFGLSSSRDISH